MTREEYRQRCLRLSAQYPDFFALEDAPLDAAPGWLGIFEKFLRETRAMIEGAALEEFRKLPVRFGGAEIYPGRVQFSLSFDTTRTDVIPGPRKRRGPILAVFRQLGALCRVAEEECATTCQFCSAIGTASAETPLRITCQRHRQVPVTELSRRFEELTAP